MVESVDPKTQTGDSKPPFWKRTWFRITAILTSLTLILGVVNSTLGLKDRVVDFLSENEPATFEECIEESDSDTDDEALVEYWYCDTEFANIWVPDGDVTMLKQNQDQILDRIGPIMGPTEQYPVSPEKFLLEHSFTHDSPVEHGQLSRLFHNWPTYESRTSFINGFVQDAHKYSENSEYSEWVFQLGTVRDPSVAVYLRVVESREWTPPSESECQIVFADVTPIARGYVSNATGGGPIDVIYGIASTFVCFPRAEEDSVDNMLENLIDGDEAIREKVMEEFEKGRSSDRW